MFRLRGCQPAPRLRHGAARVPGQRVRALPVPVRGGLPARLPAPARARRLQPGRGLLLHASAAAPAAARQAAQGPEVCTPPPSLDSPVLLLIPELAPNRPIDLLATPKTYPSEMNQPQPNSFVQRREACVRFSIEEIEFDCLIFFKPAITALFEATSCLASHAISCHSIVACGAGSDDIRTCSVKYRVFR